LIDFLISGAAAGLLARRDAERLNAQEKLYHYFPSF
jgi:hypothetical protein